MTEITRQEKAALMDAVRLGAMTPLGEVVCIKDLPAGVPMKLYIKTMEAVSEAMREMTYDDY